MSATNLDLDRHVISQGRAGSLGKGDNKSWQGEGAEVKKLQRQREGPREGESQDRMSTRSHLGNSHGFVLWSPAESRSMQGVPSKYKPFCTFGVRMFSSRGYTHTCSRHPRQPHLVGIPDASMQKRNHNESDQSVCIHLKRVYACI